MYNQQQRPYNQKPYHNNFVSQLPEVGATCQCGGTIEQKFSDSVYCKNCRQAWKIARPAPTPYQKPQPTNTASEVMMTEIQGLRKEINDRLDKLWEKYLQPMMLDVIAIKKQTDPDLKEWKKNIDDEIDVKKIVK